MKNLVFRLKAESKKLTEALNQARYVIEWYEFNRSYQSDLNAKQA